MFQIWGHRIVGVIELFCFVPDMRIPMLVGMTEKGSPSHPVGAQPTSQQQSAKW
jgi:hypothetical protein